MTKDLRLELRARNNPLWHLIFDGYKNVAEFSRIHGLNQVEVGRLLNLQQSPYKVHKGHTVLRDTARKLCEIAAMPAEDPFPLPLYTLVTSPKAVIEADTSVFVRLLEARAMQAPAELTPDGILDEKEKNLTIASVLDTLTPRERMVLELRYGLHDGIEHTLRDVGEMLPAKVSGQRIMQIEMKALRKLRHPSRYRKLRPFIKD